MTSVIALMSSFVVGGRVLRRLLIRGRHRMSTSNCRPSQVSTGAPSSRRLIRSVSAVADIVHIARSGRSVDATSMLKASPISVVRFRSWTSSKMRMLVPGSSGSFWSRRVRMPSVTTSIRAFSVITASSRVRYPTSSPRAVPESSAIR